MPSQVEKPWSLASADVPTVCEAVSKTAVGLPLCPLALAPVLPAPAAPAAAAPVSEIAFMAAIVGTVRWRPTTLLMIVCCPAALTAYPDTPQSTYREGLMIAPPSKWLTKPSDVNGRTKNDVSEMVLARPMFTNG